LNFLNLLQVPLNLIRSLVTRLEQTASFPAAWLARYENSIIFTQRSLLYFYKVGSYQAQNVGSPADYIQVSASTHPYDQALEYDKIVTGTKTWSNFTGRLKRSLRRWMM
jgi:hypothetical protein